jgi:hypothetical protein
MTELLDALALRSRPELFIAAVVGGCWYGAELSKLIETLLRLM